jgi:hypothetical protein
MHFAQYLRKETPSLTLFVQYKEALLAYAMLLGRNKYQVLAAAFITRDLSHLIY